MVCQNKQQAKEARTRFASLADRIRITEEKVGILNENEISLVGRRWKENRGSEYDIRKTKAWRWLGPRLEEFDRLLKNYNVEVSGQRRYTTTYIPGLCQDLCAGVGLVLNFTCGCMIDLTVPGIQQLTRDCNEGGGCSRVTVMRQLFRPQRLHRPSVYYASIEEEGLINKKIEGSWEAKARDLNHVFSVTDNVLNGVRVMSLDEIRSVGIDVDDLVPGEGLVFRYGRKKCYGIVVNYRGYGQAGVGYGDVETRILVLAQGPVKDEFGEYF